MRTHVWYHAGCWDGFGAAWAVYRAWDKWKPEPKYREVRYGEPLPASARGDRIWFLDFAPKRGQLERLVENDCDVLILDHHKSAAEAYSGWKHEKVEKHFDMGHSGAAMAWAYFVNGGLTEGHYKNMPVVISYIEDRDLWKWDLPDSKEVNAAMRSFPRSFKLWDDLFADGAFRAHDYATQGRAILREQQRLVNERLSQAVPIQLTADIAAPAVNETAYFSEVAGQLAERSKQGVGVAFFVRSDGMIQWSLRSKGAVDVSKIAAMYGGGGHFAAAGFETQEMLPKAEE